MTSLRTLSERSVVVTGSITSRKPAIVQITVPIRNIRGQDLPQQTFPHSQDPKEKSTVSEEAEHWPLSAAREAHTDRCLSARFQATGHGSTSSITIFIVRHRKACTLYRLLHLLVGRRWLGLVLPAPIVRSNSGRLPGRVPRFTWMLVVPPDGLWGVLAWRIAMAVPLNRVILWIAFKTEEAARKARWLCHHYLPMRRIAYIHARSMANAESASVIIASALPPASSRFRWVRKESPYDPFRTTRNSRQR